MSLDLTKSGVVVDSEIRSPLKPGATMADKTYYYKKDVGDSKNLVIIAVHFKDISTIEDQAVAIVDGIWQISEIAREVKVDTKYDKMRIANVSADTIKMDNKDNTITLSKNKDVILMGGIKIRTSNQYVVDAANPLRYYIYSEKNCQCGGLPCVTCNPSFPFLICLKLQDIIIRMLLLFNSLRCAPDSTADFCFR